MEGILKALSEPIRLNIVYLLTFSELCICEIQSVFELPQSTTSRHMKYLKDKGLVTSEQRGRWIYYKLSRPSSEFHKLILEAISNGLKNERNFMIILNKLKKHKALKNCDKID